jgi:polysaccharide biosynthesis transport protein
MSQSSASAYAPMRVGEGRSDAVHLGQIGRALTTRWRWIAFPALTVFAASAVFVSVVAPRYTGEAKLILENRDSFYTRPTQDRADAPSQIDEQAVASQVQVVMSRDLAREAIRKLDLVGNPEFDPLVGEMTLLKRLMILLGLSKNPHDRPPEERILETYYDRLLVYPVGKSRIVAVEFRSRDPELAARGANAIAELYTAMQEEAKKDTARSASTWLGANIDGLRRRVAEAEAKVEAFRAKAGLFLGSNNGNVDAQHLTDLAAQLAQARTTHADAQAKASLIRDLIKSEKTFEIPDVANNELIRRLIEQRVNLRAQLALEERTLLQQHPRIKELKAQADDLESQVRGAAERIVRTLENDARIAASRVETLQSTIETHQKVVAQANGSEVQLRALEREAKAERDQLEAYLARYREAMARDAENAIPADARIVSRAVVPALPSFPKKLPIVIFATLATAVLAAGAVVARELLAAASAPPDRRSLPVEQDGYPGSKEADYIYDRAEAWPLPALRREEAAVSATTAETAEEERFVLAALIARLASGEPQGRSRRVLVTGVEPSKAAGDLAMALGRALANQGRAIRVALDRAEGAGAAPGFTDLVAGEASFLDIIGRDPASRLDLVGAGLLDQALLTEEPQAVEIALAAFDETYDWVVCFLEDSSDPRLLSLLAPRIDTLVFASDAEEADPALLALYERAKEAGARDVVVAREKSEAILELAAA